METREQLLATITAIHEAGLNPGLWPDALDHVTRYTGCWHASLEQYDLETEEHLYWHGHGVDPVKAEEYLQFFYRAGSIKPGAEADRHLAEFPRNNVIGLAGRTSMPFYAATDYLENIDRRDFAAGILADTGQTQTILTLRRNPRQGNIDEVNLSLLSHLMPHLRQALEVAACIGDRRPQSRALSEILDWIDHAAIVLRRDGRILYANAAFSDLVDAKDGVTSSDGYIAFADRLGGRRISAALDAILNTEASEGPVSIMLSRPSGRRNYVAALRPLLSDRDKGSFSQAAAILFIRDPAARSAMSIEELSAQTGLTRAESNLAIALTSGISPADYAAQEKLSTNTVYTHLRHIKDKLNARKLPDLIRKLNTFFSPGLRGVSGLAMDVVPALETVSRINSTGDPVDSTPGRRIRTSSGFSYYSLASSPPLLP